MATAELFERSRDNNANDAFKQKGIDALKKEHEALIRVDGTVPRDVQRDILKAAGFGVFFSGTKAVTHGHTYAYAARAICRVATGLSAGVLSNKSQVKNPELSTLCIGCGSYELSQFLDKSNVICHMGACESKDSQRIEKHLAQEVAKHLMNKLKDNKTRAGKALHRKVHAASLEGCANIADVLSKLRKVSKMPTCKLVVGEYARASTIVSFDSIYNYSYEEIDDLFVRTGASTLHAVCMLPYEFFFPHCVKSRHYTVLYWYVTTCDTNCDLETLTNTAVKKRCKLSSPTLTGLKQLVKLCDMAWTEDKVLVSVTFGHNNGYVHTYKKFSKFTKGASFSVNGRDYVFEIDTWINPMASITITKASHEWVAKAVVLPEHKKFVRLLDLRKLAVLCDTNLREGVDRSRGATQYEFLLGVAGKIQNIEQIYYSVTWEVWMNVTNWIARNKNVHELNIDAVVRYIAANMDPTALVTGDEVAAWEISASEVYKVAESSLCWFKAYNCLHDVDVETIPWDKHTAKTKKSFFEKLMSMLQVALFSIFPWFRSSWKALNGFDAQTLVNDVLLQTPLNEVYEIDLTSENPCRTRHELHLSPTDSKEGCDMCKTLSRYIDSRAKLYASDITQKFECKQAREGSVATLELTKQMATEHASIVRKGVESRPDGDALKATSVRFAKALEDLPTDVKLSLPCNYLRGGPGTGKSDVIKFLCDEYKQMGVTYMIMVPFSELKDEYRREEYKCQTFHVCACSSEPVDVLLVDEFTSISAEALALAVYNRNVKQLILVGDTAQCWIHLLEEGTKLNAEGQIKFEELTCHRALVNFRNKRDVVASCNDYFPDKLECARSENFSFKVVPWRTDPDASETPMTFKTAFSQLGFSGWKPDTSGLEVDVGLKTVRSMQGKTVENAILYLPLVDDIQNDAMLLVAFTRHRGTLRVCFSSEDERKKFEGKYFPLSRSAEEITKLLPTLTPVVQVEEDTYDVDEFAPIVKLSGTLSSAKHTSQEKSNQIKINSCLENAGRAALKLHLRGLSDDTSFRSSVANILNFLKHFGSPIREAVSLEKVITEDSFHIALDMLGFTKWKDLVRMSKRFRSRHSNSLITLLTELFNIKESSDLYNTGMMSLSNSTYESVVKSSPPFIINGLLYSERDVVCFSEDAGESFFPIRCYVTVPEQSVVELIYDDSWFTTCRQGYLPTNERAPISHESCAEGDTVEVEPSIFESDDGMSIDLDLSKVVKRSERCLDCDQIETMTEAVRNVVPISWVVRDTVSTMNYCAFHIDESDSRVVQASLGLSTVGNRPCLEEANACLYAALSVNTAYGVIELKHALLNAAEPFWDDVTSPLIFHGAERETVFQELRSPNTRGCVGTALSYAHLNPQAMVVVFYSHDMTGMMCEMACSVGTNVTEIVYLSLEHNHFSRLVGPQPFHRGGSRNIRLKTKLLREVDNTKRVEVSDDVIFTTFRGEFAQEVDDLAQTFFKSEGALRVTIVDRQRFLPFELPKSGWDAHKMATELLSVQRTFEGHSLNLMSSAKCRNNVRGGRLKDKYFHGLSSKGNEAKTYSRFFSVVNGQGYHFHSGNADHELNCVTSRYLSEKPFYPFDMKAKALAEEIVDLYFSECVDLSRATLSKSEMSGIMEQFKIDAKVRNYDKKYIHPKDDDSIGVVNFNVKTFFKPSCFKSMDLTKPGQGVSAWCQTLQTRFCGVFRVLSELARRAEKPNVITDNGLNELDFQKVVLSSMFEVPTYATNAITDGTMFDSQQNAFTMYIEKYFWKRLGVNEQLIEQYYSFRHHYLIRGGFITGFAEFEKTSGEPATKENNGIVAKVLSNAIVRGVGKFVLVYKGDDFFKRQVGQYIDENKRLMINTYCPLRLKVQLNASAEFCGNIAHGSCQGPSLYRRLMKVLSHRFKDYAHFCEYQVSLRDFLMNVAAMNWIAVVRLNAAVYRKSFAHAYSVLESLISFSHINEVQFRETFLERVEFYFRPTVLRDGRLKMQELTMPVAGESRGAYCFDENKRLGCLEF